MVYLPGLTCVSYPLNEYKIATTWTFQAISHGHCES